MKTVKIEPFAADDAPTLGARKVWWFTENGWEHKGWLMPPIAKGACYEDAKR